MSAETSKHSLATVLTCALGLISIGGGLLAIGTWKGGTDAKVTTCLVKVDGHESRLQVLESEAQDSKRDRESIHREVTGNKEALEKSIEGMRQEMTKRFDRQMERLDKIADRVGVPPAPAASKP